MDLTSISRSPASRWARSICGSHPSTTRSRPVMTRQIGCPSLRRCHRSAKSEIYGFSVPTTSCAATRDPAPFAALMGEERAAMVFTDPPYNVPIDGHVSGLGAIHYRPFPMASGEMDQGTNSPPFSVRFAGTLRSIQRCRLDPLHLHGLAPCRRTPDRRSRRLWRD